MHLFLDDFHSGIIGDVRTVYTRDLCIIITSIHTVVNSAFLFHTMYGTCTTMRCHL